MDANVVVPRRIFPIRLSRCGRKRRDVCLSTFQDRNGAGSVPLDLSERRYWAARTRCARRPSLPSDALAAMPFPLMRRQNYLTFGCRRPGVLLCSWDFLSTVRL